MFFDDILKNVRYLENKPNIMKPINYLKFALLAFCFASCSKESSDDSNDLRNFTSQLCNNITGSTAAFWDSAHNLPIPLNQIPTLSNPGQQFIHSQYPALGFTMPQGYSATEDQNGLGVNVLRNDNQVVWRYVPGLTGFGEIPILDIVAAEINQLFAFYNFNGDFEVVCTQNTSTNQGTFITKTSSRLLRFNGITALVGVNTHFDASLGATFASITTATGPTAEYDNLVMETFLPISWQLLVIDNNVRDSDLDGTPDNQDNFPFDPNRQ
jgi:hypothetical protein